VKEPPAAGLGNEQVPYIELVNVTGGVAVFASVPVQRQPQVRTTSLWPLMVWVDAWSQSIVQLIVADMIFLWVIWLQVLPSGL